MNPSSQAKLQSNFASEIPQRLLSKDKKTRATIERQHYKNKVSQERSRLSQFLHPTQHGYLEPEHEGDQTLKVTQSQIKEAVNIQTASNIFKLDLSLGEYRCEYSENGSTLLLTSSQGHTSLINWRDKELLTEFNLRENVLAGKFLHNDEMIALSQTANTFIYDNRGIELHKLDRTLGLQYLPYHFLLAGYDHRKLKYYDTTTGYVIADHVAKNPYTCIRQNRSNAIIALGSAKGTVEWWTPGNGVPGVKLFVGSAVSDIGFYKGYMVTAADSIKVWDSRMLKVLHEYPLHRKIRQMEVSQTGILAVNYGFKIEMWKDFYLQRHSHPYLKYETKGSAKLNNMRFAPFEDFLGIGSNKGFECISVPGSGSSIYDTFELNPFESKKQKRQALVHRLLEKLPYETITIDPNVLGNMDRTEKSILDKEQKQEESHKQREQLEKTLSKKKMRGKGTITKRVNRKTIEMEKIKRKELTEMINKKLWGKWAQKKKKQTQVEMIRDLEDKGLGISDLIAAQKIQKTKKISKQPQ